MDILTFVVEITKAAAWPIAAFGIALLFRTQLQALLSRMKKGKLGPAEFEFEETVRVLQQEAAELPTPSSAATVGAPTISLATSDPRAAVMSSWLEVESAVLHLARTKGNLDPQVTRNPYQAIRALQTAGVVEPHYIALFNDLRGLRNQAAHELEFNPSTESVLTFARMAKDLATVLQRAGDSASSSIERTVADKPAPATHIER